MAGRFRVFPLFVYHPHVQKESILITKKIESNNFFVMVYEIQYLCFNNCNLHNCVDDLMNAYTKIMNFVFKILNNCSSLNGINYLVFFSLF